MADSYNPIGYIPEGPIPLGYFGEDDKEPIAKRRVISSTFKDFYHNSPFHIKRRTKLMEV
jgi:hypothetical protein